MIHHLTTATILSSKSGPHRDGKQTYVKNYRMTKISLTASVMNTPCKLPERVTLLKSQGDGSFLDIFTSHEETNNIIVQQTFMAVEQGAE